MKRVLFAVLFFGCSASQIPDPCSAEALDANVALCKLGVQEAQEAGNDALVRAQKAACLAIIEEWSKCGGGE